MSNQQGTFADLLITRGLNLHPETVLVNASEIHDLIDDNVILYKDTPCIPPFKRMFVELQTPNSSELAGMYIERAILEDKTVIVDGQPFIRDKDGIVISEYSGLALLEPNGYVKDIQLRRTDIVPRFELLFGVDPHKFPYAMHQDQANEMFAYGLFAIQQFHLRAEVEFVDYPRNYRRRVERETGKEPSPFFMLHVRSDKPRKKDEGERPEINPNHKTKLPETLVRGHVRIVSNHPIEQFNGVFWIDMHTRGNKDNGQIKKGYTIRLPKNRG